MILIGRFMIVKYGKYVNGVFLGETRIKKIYKGIFGVIWDNPYNSETTRILMTNFPQKFVEICRYGNMHSQIVPFINEDPMLVCSLGIEGLPIRWHRMVNGYWDTGLQVTMNNWNKIRYILDAVATTTNVGNRWFANGIGGGSICGLHVGLNNGTSNYTSAPFTYGNGYNDVTLSNETKGSYGKHYRWDFDILHETYKVYDDTGTLIVNVAATLKAPTANNTSGGITVGRWHQYNNINSGSTHSADTRECLQYVDDELVNWFVPFTRNGVFGMMNLMTNTFASVSGTSEEKFGWWENGSFIEWTPST